MYEAKIQEDGTAKVLFVRALSSRSVTREYEDPLIKASRSGQKIRRATWLNDDRRLGIEGRLGIHLRKYGSNEVWTGYDTVEEATAHAKALNDQKQARWFVFQVTH